MKKLTLVLTLLVTAPSFGSIYLNGPLDEKLYSSEVNESESYFDTLGKMFDEGMTPDLNKISNIAWAGRCFKVSAPFSPVNGGYIFREKNSDVGPLGDSFKVYEAATYWKENETTSYYDNLGLEDVLRVQKYLKFHNVRLTNNSVEISHVKNNVSELRLSGEYLVEEISYIEESLDVGPLGGEPPRTPGIRCYYFIPEYVN